MGGAGGHILNPQVGTSPTSPPQGDLSPWGPAHFKQPFGLAAPRDWTMCISPSPPRTRLPRPSLPAGRNRRGLSRPNVNIGFSGAVAGTRQWTRLSPPAAQKGLS